MVLQGGKTREGDLMRKGENTEIGATKVGPFVAKHGDGSVHLYATCFNCGECTCRPADLTMQSVEDHVRAGCAPVNVEERFHV